MAQIVCIDKDTLKEGVNEIDDIVAIHDDDVDLSGEGYAGFKIVKVAGKTAVELRAAFKRPEQRRAVRVVSDQWCFMEEKEVWKNPDGKWCDLVSQPKYPFSVKELTIKDIETLESKKAAAAEKEASLSRVVEKVHLDEKNNVEVLDLNQKG